LNEKGFYITFDNEAPKRPKPPLRTRSPAKRRDGSAGPRDRLSNAGNVSRDLTTEYIQSIVDHVPIQTDSDDDPPVRSSRNNVRERITSGSDAEPGGGGELVIDEKPQLDPVRSLYVLFNYANCSLLKPTPVQILTRY